MKEAVRKKSGKNPNGLIVGDIIKPMSHRKRSNDYTLKDFQKLKIEKATTYTGYNRVYIDCIVLEGKPSLWHGTRGFYADAFELYTKQGNYDIF